MNDRNRTGLIDDALALSLTVSVGDGRIRIEGPAADVKRAFVMQGLDSRREGDTGWSMWDGARLAATIGRMPKDATYAYGYTVAS